MNKFFLYFAAASIGGVSSLHAGKTPQIKQDELKHLSAQPAPAPAEGAARNVDQRDFDDPDYGGIRGHQLFLEDRPTIIKNLVQLLLKYKGRCEALLASGKADEVGYPKEAVEFAAKRRKLLARLTHSKNAAEFGVPRTALAVTSTPLNQPNYRHLRVHLSERINTCLRNIGSLAEWQTGGYQTSRFMVETMPLTSCPTSISALRWNDAVRIFQDTTIPLADLLGPLSSCLGEVVFYTHFEDFLRIGCFKPIDSYEDPQSTYQYALMEYLRTKMDCPKEMHISYLNAPAGCKAHYTLAFDSRHSDKHVETFEGKEQPWFFRVQLAERIPGTQNYLPTYKIMGLTQGEGRDKNTLGMPMIINHPHGVFVPHLEKLYQNTLHEAVMIDKPDRETLIRLVGLYCYYWTRTMPWIRGSAAGEEWIEESLYNLHGFTRLPMESELTVDERGFLSFTQEEFLTWYCSNVKLGDLVLE